MDGVAMKARPWPAYLICAAVAAAIYVFLSIHTQWTLFPYTKALNALFGFHFYAIDDGYQAAGSGFMITRTCSGVNLFAGLCMILVFGFLHRFHGTKRRTFAAMACIVAALLVTFIATLARIILSLPFAESEHFKLIHTVLSLCVFYGTGLLVYWCAHKVVRRYTHETQTKVV